MLGIALGLLRKKIRDGAKELRSSLGGVFDDQLHCCALEAVVGDLMTRHGGRRHAARALGVSLTEARAIECGFEGAEVMGEDQCRAVERTAPYHFHLGRSLRPTE